MKVFLDTSVLSDERRQRTGEELLKQYSAGGQLYISVITHFKILWGYLAASMPSENYDEFLQSAGLQIAPLIRADAEEAATMKPTSADLLDALIASCAKRYGATVWTSEKDFLKFLPKSRVRIF